MSDQALDQDLIRALPSNIPAEQMLLGAILINHELMNHVSEFLRAEHFLEILHQNIYKSIKVISEKGLTPTPITLKSMLERDPLFLEVGGSDYLHKLVTMSMMVINSKDYGRIIYDLAMRRNLIQIGEMIVNTAYDSTLEHSAIQQIEKAESMLYELASAGINDKSFVKLHHSIADSLARINRAIKNPDQIVGITTGLTELDNTTLGFHNSDLVIIAGRPSMGKTAFALNFALNACKALHKRDQAKHDQPADSTSPSSVGFISLEMSSEQLAGRLLSMYTGLDSTALRKGIISEENYNNLKIASIELSELPFYIDDTPALSIAAIRTRARKMKRKNNLGILFVDYLQLIKSSDQGGGGNRVLEISEITQGLKAIAKELNIPVIALSQLSRAVEQREDKRPMLSDLRESGSIEQDADIVMFLYREEYYLARKMSSEEDPKYNEWCARLQEIHNITDLIIAKHRNGPVGIVKIFYDAAQSKINNLQKVKK